MRAPWALSATLLLGCAQAPAASVLRLAPPPAAVATEEVRTAPHGAPRPPRSALDPTTPGLYGAVVESPSGAVWVIDAQPDGVRAGALRSDVEGELQRVEATVELTSIPEAKRLEGREVDLFDGAELVCRARLGGLSLAGHALWSSFDRAALGLQGPPDAPEPTDAEVQREVAEETPLWLVAALPDDPACARATWGRLASLPPPEQVELLPEPDASAAVAQLRASKPWRDHQAAYHAHEQNAVQWGYTPTGKSWMADPSAVTRARAFRFRGEELVLVGLESGEPCSFRATLRGLFRRTPRGLEAAWIDEGVGVEGLLLDLDLDGQLERVSEHGAGGLEADDTWSGTDTRPAHQSCGC